MTIYLGLGSNLGDRIRYLERALDQLDAHGIAIVQTASIYETEPRDSPPGSPLFLNTTVEANSAVSLETLLQTCLEIERREGRVRTEPNAPRTLDVDILLFGNEIIETERITVPHPRYTERRFVLVPLNEIAPDLVDPARKRTVRELLAACADKTNVTVYRPPLGGGRFPARPSGG